MTKNATGFAAFAHGSVADVKLISMIIVKSIPNVAANPNDPKDYSLSHGVFYDAAEVNKKLSDKLPQEDKRAAVREFVFYKCHNLRLKAVLLEANFCFPADPVPVFDADFFKSCPLTVFALFSGTKACRDAILALNSPRVIGVYDKGAPMRTGILALANEMKSKITTDSVAEGVSSSQQSLSYYNKKHKEKPFYVLSPFETE